jgi:sucrose phosphorylase
MICTVSNNALNDKTLVFMYVNGINVTVPKEMGAQAEQEFFFIPMVQIISSTKNIVYMMKICYTKTIEGKNMTDTIKTLLRFIYGETAGEILPRLEEILDTFKRDYPAASAAPGQSAITHKDAFLITYGDMLSAGETGASESALKRLGRFLAKWNRGSFSYLHLLPFHPYSSDDGFSVIDYHTINPRLGDWNDIEELGRHFRLAFDFVINHGSVQSEWFQKFLAGEEKFRNWYLTRDEHYDWSKVFRPRTHPLLTPFIKNDGSTAWVWTTFSADQVDYDFSRPEVLLEFINIFLEYSRRGGRMVRLDAIAYLWKEDGTPCLHHPKTHAMVALLRAIIGYLGLETLVLTETNVPHAENLSYFGGEFALAGEAASVTSTPPAENEAHLVYNFALPPLVLHAAVSGNALPLRNWAASLPALGADKYFLNFLASHDGVGLGPARGLIDEADFSQTLEEAKKRGALISFKSAASGPVPYELNCSWADMVAPESLMSVEAQAGAFLTSYAAALALPGLPAVYFHSWIGSRAWKAGPEKSGSNRAINREKPAIDAVEKELSRPGSFRALALEGFQKLFEFRAACPAFGPEVPCRVLDYADKGLFALLRGPDAQGGSVLCVQNFSAHEADFDTGIQALGRSTIAPRGLRWTFFDPQGIRRELAL